MFRLLAYVLWIAPSAIEVAIVVQLWRKRLIKSSPVFFAFLVFDLVRSVALAAILNLDASAEARYSAYFYTYWTTEVLAQILVLIILYLAFQSTFQPAPMLRRWTTIAYTGVVAVMLTAAIGTVVASQPTKDGKLMASILSIQQNVMLLRCGLVVTLFVFCAYMGISLRKLAFGIVLGFGLESCALLALTALRSHFGNSWNVIFNNSAAIAYTFETSMWLVYLHLDVQSRGAPNVPSTAMLEDWNQCLKEFLQR